MKKKKQLKKINRHAAGELLDIKGLINAAIIINDESYPNNVLLTLINQKLNSVFDNIEKNRKILKIIN